MLFSLINTDLVLHRYDEYVLYLINILRTDSGKLLETVAPSNNKLNGFTMIATSTADSQQTFNSWLAFKTTT